MTDPVIEKKVNALLKMVAYLIRTVHKEHPMPSDTEIEKTIRAFEPPLMKAPKMCEEDNSLNAERMLKAARKHLKKADFKTMDNNQRKEWADRMAEIIEINHS